MASSRRLAFVVFVGGLLAALPGAVRAAGSAASITGVITGPDGKPLAGVAVVLLRNDISGFPRPRGPATETARSASSTSPTIPTSCASRCRASGGAQILDVRTASPASSNSARAAAVTAR